ncbi:hypothetical protein PAERUG_P19_London_7_VIM_2_05_10_00686 [Pseudomonas aeruginosa]|uniref:Uncharacterized protein n=1 Tax=Pseudomonas aeruginosa TaxID=287 RepID=A0A9P1R3I5_PSEAI|nr:hypothetical protein Y89_1838 [Pseudomonas aeruginosa]CDI91565.1 hypothetical protein BN889_03528 [Pseudomonas aeruginosa PA38182]AXO27796.1 hypothetical protein Ysp71_1839 [Pseudomonas aeruginosa]KYO93164.1 hypothetical protein LT19_01393 [Pseudomonas aeruginosa]QGH90245.1 hypothetical protein PaeAG1_02028 [Pseudomonas aeruginosa]
MHRIAVIVLGTLWSVVGLAGEGATPVPGLWRS